MFDFARGYKYFDKSYLEGGHTVGETEQAVKNAYKI